MFARLFEMSLMRQSIGKVVMGGGIIGLKAQGLRVVSEASLVFPCFRRPRAKIVCAAAIRGFKRKAISQQASASSYRP